MAEVLNAQPPGWGADALSSFIDAARSNMFASSHNFRGPYRRMVDIDSVYLSLFDDFKDPEHPLGAALAFRCHSALRAAAQLSLAGQVPEAFMVLRGSLEMALYAYHASTSLDRAHVWINRDDDEASKRKCQQEFTGRRIFPELMAKDAEIGRVSGELYERAIEYGAHPNARGVLTTLTHEEGDTEDSFSFAYLTGDELTLLFALKSWSQVAVCSLDVLSLVFPLRFATLKLQVRIQPLRAGL